MMRRKDKICSFTDVKTNIFDAAEHKFDQNTVAIENLNRLLVNVRERVGSPGYFYDNFFDEYASYTSYRIVDFKEIPSLITSRIYTKLHKDKFKFEDLENGVSELSDEALINISCLIALPETALGEVEDSLYAAYQQFTGYDFKYINFIVAFVGDSNKANRYIENYNLYGIAPWDKFDSSVSKLVTIQDIGLPIDEFREYFL